MSYPGGNIVYTYRYIYIYTYTHTYICVYIYIQIYIFTYTYTCTNTHIYIYIHTYICIHMLIYIHTCVYIYIYIKRFKAAVVTLLHCGSCALFCTVGLCWFYSGLSQAQGLLIQDVAMNMFYWQNCASYVGQCCTFTYIYIKYIHIYRYR